MEQIISGLIVTVVGGVLVAWLIGDAGFGSNKLQAMKKRYDLRLQDYNDTIDVSGQWRGTGTTGDFIYSYEMDIRQRDGQLEGIARASTIDNRSYTTAKINGTVQNNIIYIATTEVIENIPIPNRGPWQSGVTNLQYVRLSGGETLMGKVTASSGHQTELRLQKVVNKRGHVA